MADTFQIKKSFHFHAAHRNNDLPGGHKCRSIHGHTYHLDCHVELEKTDDSSYTILFSEIEKMILPIVHQFEHSLMMDKADDLYEVLKDKGMKIALLDFPPSTENLTKYFFDSISKTTSLNIVQVDLRETSSSGVTYLKPKSK